MLISTSRQLSVEVDEQGFIRLDRYREDRKINLRKDAMFEMINTIRDLSEKYILELKLRKAPSLGTGNEEDEEVGTGMERIIMIRYVVFT